MAELNRTECHQLASLTNSLLKKNLQLKQFLFWAALFIVEFHTVDRASAVMNRSVYLQSL